MLIVSKFLAKAALCAVFALLLAGVGLSQARGTAKKNQAKKTAAVVGPKVTQIDIDGLRKLLKPNGKPLLINFWATWCDPCREEFPDLIKLDTAYKGRVDFITISLDDLADIKTHVPKFLGEMKAEMPAYLLKTPDDDAAIALVSKDWRGNLPLTILYDTPGSVAYERNGKFRYETLLAEIDKVLAAGIKPPLGKLQPIPLPSTDSINSIILVRSIELLPIPSPYTYEKGVSDAEKEISTGKYRIVRYGLTPGTAPSAEFDRLLNKYSLTVSETGCMVSQGFPDYARGFNQTMRAAFEKRFGVVVAQEMGMGPYL